MITIDKIGDLKECRIWLENLPSADYEIEDTLSTIIETSSTIKRSNQNIAIELFIAPRYYALLGMKYIYKESSHIEVRADITKDTGKMFNHSLALPSDNVHLGILKEYAQPILDTSKKILMKSEKIPTGVIKFDLGGYSEYGSNSIIFSKVTSVLLKILINIQENINHEELKKIVRKELEKPLTDI